MKSSQGTLFTATSKANLLRCPSCQRLLGASTHECPNDVPRNCKFCSRPLRDTGFEGKSRICTTCWKPKSHAQQKRAKRELKELMGGKCGRCNYNRSIHALHFHHVDSTEKRSWRKDGKVSIAEVRTHPERFELLCANCHAEEHLG